VDQLYCMASGSVARRFGLPGGLIAPGQPADLVSWDPVVGSETDEFVDCVSYGDRAYPGLIMVDGEIREHGNPLLLDPKRIPTVTHAT
jgi:enamidase